MCLDVVLWNGCWDFVPVFDGPIETAAFIFCCVVCGSDQFALLKPSGVACRNLSGILFAQVFRALSFECFMRKDNFMYFPTLVKSKKVVLRKGSGC